MDDRAGLIAQLRQSRDDFLDAIGGVSPAQASYKPPDGGWSIAECAEHVALAESGMFALITRHAVAAAAAAGAEERERAALALATDRNRKMTAPEPSRPGGRFASLDEAVAYFRERRERTIHYIESCEDDLRSRTVAHPIAGTLTCRECLMLMIGHPARHAGQIREIRRSPQFPS